MRRHSFTLALLFLALNFIFAGIATPTCAAQQTPSRADNSVPSPRSYLGFNPGDDRTIADWRQITGYFARLDQLSARVSVRTLGETTLHRPFIVVFISAPENIRELQKYQEIQRKLADPRLVRDDAERDALLRDGKTVVAISCSIHSTEIVASQMSMQLAYDLASAQDVETREILQNTILMLIPSANPDGIDIVANWYRKTLNTPYEGKEPPELYHHYAGHDDNRDWFMLNLPETKLVTRLFWKEWFPEIVYDVHQQGMTGSRFFIPPFYDPSNPHIAPLLLRQVGLIGHKMAADLQGMGQQGVITNALYDTWWHGGFRTAPYYHNSIGILSEAASAHLMTPVRVTPEQLSKSTTRGMTTALQATTNFPDPWPGGLWRPRDIMNIELTAARSMLSLAAKYRMDYLRDFYELGRKAINGPETTGQSAQGKPLAYLIPAGQGRDEAVAKMVSTLVQQGVEVYRLDRELHGDFGEQVIRRAATTTSAPAPATDAPADKGARRMMTRELFISPVMQGQEAPAGSYLIFLNQPYRENVLALFEPQIYPDRINANGEAERPYDVAGWTLPMQMGIDAFVVTRINQPYDAKRLTLVKNETDVRRDLGLPLQRAGAGSNSPITNPLKRKVRVALYKSWTGSMDEGWTRYVFDTFNVPYTSLLDQDVRRGNLRARYDVIVIPSQRDKELVEGNAQGSYPAEFNGGMTVDGVDNLRRFVQEGGTLVCFDAASEMLIKRFGLPLVNVLDKVKSSDFYCPGSILRIELDTKHPIAAGMPASMDAYFINSSAFEVTDPQRVRVVARYAGQDLLRSGWLLGESRINGKVAIAEIPMGAGRVIVFGFRPQHRGQMWGTFPLIFNSLTMGEP
jgi:hypothetical protein